MADKKVKTKDAVNPFARIEAAKPTKPATKTSHTGYKKPPPPSKSIGDYVIGGMEGVGNYLRGTQSKKK